MTYQLRFGKRATGALYRGTWVIEWYPRRWGWGRTRTDTFDWWVGPFRFLRGNNKWEPGQGCGEFAGRGNIAMWKWVDA